MKNMKTAKQLLETYLAAISAGEMEKAIALFADDGGIEFPYFGSVNLPTRYQGALYPPWKWRIPRYYRAFIHFLISGGWLQLHLQ